MKKNIKTPTTDIILYKHWYGTVCAIEVYCVKKFAQQTILLIKTFLCHLCIDLLCADRIERQNIFTCTNVTEQQ